LLWLSASRPLAAAAAAAAIVVVTAACASTTHSPTVGPASSTIDNARCDAVQPVGSHVDTVFGLITADAGRTLPAGWESLLLTGLAEHFRPPAAIDLAVRGGTRNGYPGGGDTVSLSIDGQVAFRLSGDGRIDETQLTARTLSPALDASLLASVRRLDSARHLPGVPLRFGEGPIRVRFTITQHVDSLAIPMALFVSRQPDWILERGARALPTSVPPRYPMAARRAGLMDSVLVSFVIDEAGLPLMETSRVVSGRYRDFQIAVLEALPHIRFMPAMIAGCAVPQRVRMPFVFSLR
jgi:TonB family protein